MRSLCSILDAAATELGQKPLFVFPETRWNAEEALTYADLAMRSMAAASVFAQHARPGDRALLLFPTGPAFWEAFFGCLSRQIIAVPLHIPNLKRNRDALEHVCRDCNPSLVITDEKTAELLRRQSETGSIFNQIPWVTSDQWRGETSAFHGDDVSPQQTAFLQYTSGSTARPKGIQNSHGNLAANLSMIRDRMGIRDGRDSGVTWLPHYHDMGLIGSYLTTFFTRNTSWCLPPEDFVLNPARWLQLISTHSASICGGPDFAYRLCAERIPVDQLTNIDLSSWRVAYIGAERIRADTLSRFTVKFAGCGFRNTALFPCYGLGEATLMATGGPSGVAPVIRHFSSAALQKNRIETSNNPDDTTTLVGSGQSFDGSKVVIRDLETSQSLGEDTIGEICLSGPAVTAGYFHRDELNSSLFREIQVNGHAESYLLTGDLGFLSEGQLFITGRTKETIIIRGRNFSPEDIEQRIDGRHPSLMLGGAVAFSVETNGQEALIIAAELRRTAMQEEVYAAVALVIRNGVTEAFGINPQDILLLRQASIPRTSSGKPKRLAVRDSYLDGTLPRLFQEKNLSNSEEK